MVNICFIYIFLFVSQTPSTPDSLALLKYLFTMFKLMICMCEFINLMIFLHLFSHHRIVVSRSKMVRSLITKDYHIARLITMQNVDRCAPAARNQLPADASQQCSVNSIPNISFAHSVWSNWIRERLKNRTISHTVTIASTNCSVDHVHTKYRIQRHTPTPLLPRTLTTTTVN